MHTYKHEKATPCTHHRCSIDAMSMFCVEMERKHISRANWSIITALFRRRQHMRKDQPAYKSLVTLLHSTSLTSQHPHRLFTALVRKLARPSTPIQLSARHTHSHRGPQPTREALTSFNWHTFSQPGFYSRCGKSKWVRWKRKVHGCCRFNRMLCTVMLVIVLPYFLCSYLALRFVSGWSFLHYFLNESMSCVM